MKIFFCFWLLASLVSAGRCQEKTGAHPSAAGPKDPVCGFTKNFRYLEADTVKTGLVANFAVAAPPRINQPATLRFFVHQKPGDIPEDHLQIEHEKFIHVIGVRDDLNEFFHLHPVKVAPGVWEVTHTFTHGGNYKIWSDVRFLDVSYAFGQPMLSLAGNFGGAGGNVIIRDRDERAGFQITFKHTEPLLAGRSSSLQFLVRDAAGREIETEDFLGAPMHLVIVKDDLSVYLHAHPEHQELPEPTIIFNQVFPKAGVYKLFAQFRPKHAILPPDDAVLSEFYVKVGAAESSPDNGAAK